MERKVSCLLPNGRLLFAVLLQFEVTALVRTLSPLYFLQTTCTFFLTSDSFEFMMLESESPASDLDLQSFKSTDTGDVPTEPSVFRVLGTWSSDQRFFNNDDTHQSFQSSGSSELDQIQSSFLLFFRTSSSWKLKTFNRTSGLQDSLTLGSSELTLIPVDCFRCRVPSCHDLQNFKPLESGDVHSELLVFRLLWRLVLQSLQVLNAEAVQSELLVFRLISIT